MGAFESVAIDATFSVAGLMMIVLVPFIRGKRTAFRGVPLTQLPVAGHAVDIKFVDLRF